MKIKMQDVKALNTLAREQGLNLNEMSVGAVAHLINSCKSIS